MLVFIGVFMHVCIYAFLSNYAKDFKRHFITCVPYALTITIFPSDIHFVAGRFGFGCLDDETVAAVRESLNLEVLPRHLSFLESLLVSSSSGSHEICCLLRFSYKFFHSCYSNIGRLDCWHRRAKHR